VERIAAVVEENKLEIAGLEDKIDEAEMDNWEAQESIAQLEDEAAATAKRNDEERESGAQEETNPQDDGAR
jgi:hypothetical protein